MRLAEKMVVTDSHVSDRRTTRFDVAGELPSTGLDRLFPGNVESFLG